MASGGPAPLARMYREQLCRRARSVCTVGLLPGLNDCSFDFEIEFEANPKPDVTWEMQVEKGRNGETVKEGKSKGNYEALDIEEDVSSHSSEIRGLRSTKCSSETLQNLLYFMYKKTHVVFFVFHFVQLYIFTL